MLSRINVIKCLNRKFPNFSIRIVYVIVEVLWVSLWFFKCPLL